MDVLNQTAITKGGEFLIKDTEAHTIFIPEEFSEEQLMMRQTAYDFIKTEIEPRIDLIDSQKDLTIVPKLVEKTGELGFLAVGVPEEYDGIEMDFTTALSNVEVMAGSYSFSLAIGVQTSIGIAPILLYGNEEQKAKYLPKLVTGEWKTCYCLTEPGSGSDANSGKTRAVLNEEGTHYIINGQKMWITSGGFANIFIVFAKIDDDKNLSAFIVEEEFGGVTRGAEEKKMGIKGSSTCQLFFNNVKVPVENMLGDRQQGFKIAVNVLNTGRIKLGASAIGVGKKTIGFATNYANERIQFGKPISSFGAIKHKIGNMAAKTYGIESAIFRTGKDIDRTYDELLADGMEKIKAKSKCVEEYAIECALLKVYGSEAQDYITDEGVQIYGGMGFSAETPVERLYRDARITRIFEGTNEINRMLIVDMLLKKAMKGKLDLMTPAMAVQKELMAIPSFGGGSDDYFAEEKKALANFKKAALIVAGAGVQKLTTKLKHEQEVLMNVADMITQIYIFESALLRTEKLRSIKGEAAIASQIDMTRILMYEAANVMNNAGKEAIYAFAEGDEQRMLLLGVKRFTKLQPFNLKSARRRVADVIIEANKYVF